MRSAPAVKFISPYRHGTELNQVEKWKLERHPLDVAESIINDYSKKGSKAIDAVPGEQERLKWVGIYPQRQGGNAFMMRIKLPGGRLNSEQAIEIGNVASKFARGPEHPIFKSAYCDITTRQAIQLHWIRIEDVPEIWSRFESVGMTTIQACGDSARNVLSCPAAGIDADEAFDSTQVVNEISEFFTGNREYANLPRKFKLSVTGCRDDCAQGEINDIGLWPARLEDGTLGFNLLVGGGLSDGPRMASDVDVFVEPKEAVELTRAVAQLFGELGNRENRGLSRMRYLVEEMGPEEFRSELVKRSQVELRQAGTHLTRRYRGDHIGLHPQKQPGLSYLGVSVTVGRLIAEELIEIGRLAKVYGDGDIRLTTDQNFVLSGIANEKVESLLQEELLEKHSPFPGPFTRGAIACTGSEFCRFAVVETKERIIQWAKHLDDQFGKRLGPVDSSSVVRMHFSGCPASCAQPQIADIGFRGDTAHQGDQIVEAVDIGLGGSLGGDAGFIDWIKGAFPVEDVPSALLRVIERYLIEKKPDERLSTWARRTSTESLAKTLLPKEED